MSSTPEKDHGQRLKLPKGYLIGFVDTKAELDECMTALQEGGYRDKESIVLFGEDGQELLKRDDKKFHFGDGEDSILNRASIELTKGHYLLAVEVEDRDEAVKVVNFLDPLGARRFSYFGTWINERLTS